MGNSSLIATTYPLRTCSGTFECANGKGQIEINFINQLQGQPAGVVRGPIWTLPRLANWLDSDTVKDRNRSAIEAVGDPRQPNNLLRRIITVSVKTVKIVKGLPKLPI